MRKFISLLLLLTMLIPGAIAEDVIEIPEAEALPANVVPLPVDLSAGYVPNPDCYIAADEENGVLQGYQDDSLTVTMERVKVGDSTFNVARVKIAHPSQLRTGLENEKASRNNKISSMAKKHNAVVAIGGDFFADAKNGYIVRQYKEFRKSPKSVYDMLLVDNNGDFHIVLRSDAEELKALLTSEELTFPNIFNFGPALVKDGVLLETPQYYIDNGNRYNIKSKSEPRCAIGQMGKLEYMFVVVDGRRKDSDGCSTAELAEWMFSQGCQQAYNLDGGNSALMWFGGENYSDKTTKNERTVSDFIYISTAVKPEEE
ncbi:MAG: phosphodiester glycosidase family protein [Clostridia bacterium]|nr:phosphodiester glycosidase family protein [Clostridia bacterium]